MQSEILVPYTKDITRHFRTLKSLEDGNVLTVKHLLNSVSLVGNKLPAHDKLVAMKRNATTPLDLTAVEYIHCHAPKRRFVRTIAGTSRSYEHDYWGFNPDVVKPVNASLVSLARAGALSKFSAAVREKQSPLSAQVFTGEIKDTLALLRHPFKASVELTTNFAYTLEQIGFLSRPNRGADPARLVKNASRRSKATAKSLASSWLQYRFAVLPLLSDIADILAILEKEFSEIDHLNTWWTERGAAVNSTYFGQLPVNACTIQRTYIDVARCSIRAGFLQTLESNQQGITEYFRDSLKNESDYILTGWELTPFSWLIDYFVNVQQVLDGFSHDFTALLSWSSMSTKLTRTVVEEMVSEVNPSGVITQLSIDSPLPPKLIYETKTLVRSTVTSAVPPLTFSLPGSSIKLANVAALLTQKFT